MDYSTTWSMSQSTLATMSTMDDDDEVTLAGGRRRLTGPCVLKMTPDTIKNTTFVSNGGITEYLVKTSTQNAGKSSACTRTEVLDYNGRLVGAVIKPMTNGSDMLILGTQAPITRRSWMSTGGPFSGNTVGKFHHAGSEYKWIKLENKDAENDEDKRIPKLELHSNNGTDVNPLARFMGSRRDWTASPNELVIIDAVLEIFTDNPSMVDLTVFSFVLAEKLRRDVSGAALSYTDNVGRATSDYGMAFGISGK